MDKMVFDGVQKVICWGAGRNTLIFEPSSFSNVKICLSNLMQSNAKHVIHCYTIKGPLQLNLF